MFDRAPSEKIVVSVEDDAMYVQLIVLIMISQRKFVHPRKFVIENRIMKSEKVIFEVGNADLGKYLLETLKSKPNFVGQIDAVTGEESTYRKMEDDSVRCALWLRKNGLKSGDIVYTCTSNAMYSYIPVLATFYNGAAHIFGHKSMHIEMVRRYLVDLIKPKFIFTEQEKTEMFLKIVSEEKLDTKIVVFTKVSGVDSLNEIISQSESKEVDNFCSIPPSNPDENCLFCLTSGTTADPKLVVHSYKQIMEALLTCIRNIVKGSADEIVSMIYPPMHWALSLKVNLINILIFARRIIVKDTCYDLQEAFQMIEKFKVTDVRFSIPMMYRMYSRKELPKFDTSSLKTIFFNGIKLEPRIMKFLMQLANNVKLMQTYGATELSTPMFGGIMNNIDLNSCGSMWPNMEMKIIDVQTGATLSPGEKGEICFKSPGLMKSYFQNQKATEEAIDPEGWYHTGDFGYYDESGLGYILGRVKNTLMVQISGNVIPLWKADRALHSVSDITECFILSDLEISDYSRIFAFVGLMHGSKVTEDELSEIVNNFSEITIPITVKILDELPRTSTGKIDLKELKKIAEHSMQNNSGN